MMNVGDAVGKSVKEDDGLCQGCSSRRDKGIQFKFRCHVIIF